MKKFPKTRPETIILTNGNNFASRTMITILCPLCKEERKTSYGNVTASGHTYCRGCSNTYDLTGMTFGRLTVQSYVPSKSKGARWLCVCECGNTTEVKAGHIKGGTIQSCGCLIMDVLAERNDGRIGHEHPTFIDRTGEKYGRLTTVEYLGYRYWLCECECGNTTRVHFRNLESGNTKSCGCLRQEYWDNVPNGEDHHLWNPEKTEQERIVDRDFLEYRLFREDIYERDNYTCQVCLERGGELRVHHLYNYSDYPEYRLEEKYATTLCSRCHDDFHLWMGGYRISCTPEDFQEWSGLP